MTPDELMQREKEVREAHSIYPDLEIGEAYRMYKEARGETASMLQSNDPSLKEAKRRVLRTFRKPCTQVGCSGTMLLEGICEGCIEGKKGFRTKWTCEECLHRELSKKLFSDWYDELKDQDEQNSK
jgi:hypothetical protein